MNGEPQNGTGMHARRKGLVMVNTGNGKGKTTAALGMLLRAWGRGLRVCVIQFIKPAGARFGEVRAAEKLGIEWIATGTGFTWQAREPDQPAEWARHGWQVAQERISGGEYDLILLDEFTYALAFGWLDTQEVIAWLAQHKPPMLHVVITGRDAPTALLRFADLVTDMREVKHPYAEQGLRAQPGIEF